MTIVCYVKDWEWRWGILLDIIIIFELFFPTKKDNITFFRGLNQNFLYNGVSTIISLFTFFPDSFQQRSSQ